MPSRANTALCYRHKTAHVTGDAYVNRRHRRPCHTHTLDSNDMRESSGRRKIAECTLTVQEEARETDECGEGELCRPQRPRPQCTQSDEEISEKLWNISSSNLDSSMTQRAEVSAVISQAEGPHRHVQCRAWEASAGGVAEGDQWQQAHWTKATSTTTALVEDEPDEDGIQNVREVTARARKQKDITSKLV